MCRVGVKAAPPALPAPCFSTALRWNLRRIWRVVFIVDSLVLGQHALMQDTGNQNAARVLPVKHHMLALLHPMQPRANFIARAAERGIVGNELAAIFKLAYIAVGLDVAPGAKGINADVEQIAFGAT